MICDWLLRVWSAFFEWAIGTDDDDVYDPLASEL
jgi:hypothetical protein